MSLLKAVKTGKLDRVREEIDNGADVNATDPDTKETILRVAVEKGSLAIVQALIEAGAMIEAEDPFDSPLSEATYQGNVEMVRLLTQRYPYSETSRSSYAQAFKWIAILGHVDILHCIVAAGVDINLIIDQDGTALHCAVGRSQLVIVRELLSMGADVNCTNISEEAYDRLGQTPLMLAVEGLVRYFGPSTSGEAPQEEIEIFQILLSAGADVNRSNRKGQVPLLLAAEVNRTDILQQLITAGANLDHQDSQGKTALMIAAGLGNSAVVKLLIESGTDINLRDLHGNTALIYATGAEVEEKEVEIEVEIIKEETGCQSERFRKTVEKRQGSRRKQIANLLRTAGITDDGSKEVLLIKSAANGKLGAVEALIDTGARVNFLLSKQGTALSQAVRHRHQAVVATLLVEGADPNLSAYSREKPLILAAENGDLEIVRLLLDAGADPHATDSDDPDWEGYTALDRAQKNKHRDVVQLIREKSGGRRRRVPVAEWRGLVSEDVNDRLILVQADAEAAAEALYQVRGANIWMKDVFEKEVELTNECFVVFQYSGHSWSVVHEENVYFENRGLTEEDAQKISQYLETKTINYGVSDTAGAIGYEFYDSGELIESFLDYCENDFREERETRDESHTVYGHRWKLYSRQRQIDPKDVKRSYDFVDAFMKSQDVFVPVWICIRWRQSATGLRRRLEVSGLDPEDLRMDYVAVKD